MGQRLVPATRLTKCWSQPLAARIRELIVISYRLIVQTCAPASQRLDVASGG